MFMGHGSWTFDMVDEDEFQLNGIAPAFNWCKHTSANDCAWLRISCMKKNLKVAWLSQEEIYLEQI